ncbi:MAG: hypothetical protein PHQ90_11995 [Sulfuricurvum sp.]|uniref:hypothetical protein n=1 Tax=Sulfuricurvum sp. TaxID=2025608 RepID=UPI0026193605|nr:hypothetical protein [Sulfuricurvum sp.]MDD2370014.1 hypothetical protein [Sulfuricurvum sp.]MDD2950549.1 hypothetical protein [Sulfuricurvum sp.]MDD5117936.1 hypothetical protein [Sulfuricurvum sp.]
MKAQFDPATLVVGLSFVAITIAAGWMMHEHSLLNEAALQRDASLQTSERLSSLKTRWGNSPEIKQKTDFLLAHPALIRQEKRQKSLYLEFGNLSGNDFDRIVSTLMNAPFVITKLVLSRNANAGTISVEIEQ